MVHINLAHVVSQLLWMLQSTYAMAVLLPSLPVQQPCLIPRKALQLALALAARMVLKNNQERR